MMKRILCVLLCSLMLIPAYSAENAKQKSSSVAKKLSKISLSGDFKVFQIVDEKTVLIQEDLSLVNTQSAFYGGQVQQEKLFCLTDIDAKQFHNGQRIPCNARTTKHQFSNIQYYPNTQYTCDNCFLSSPIFQNDKGEGKRWLEQHKRTKCSGKEIVIIWKIGVYSYTAIDGSTRTIPKFTYAKSVAVKHVSEDKK